MRLAILLFATTIFSNAFAQKDPEPIAKDDALVQRLIALSKTTRSIAAAFTQEKYLSVLRDPLESDGLFSYERPGRMRWEVTTPERMVALVDHKSVRIFEKGNEQAVNAVDRQVYDAITDMIEGIISGSLLSGNSMKISYFKVSEGLLVIADPLDSRMAKRLKEVRLVFDKETLMLHELRMDQPNGDHTVTRFHDARSNVDLPPATFTQF